MLTRIVVYILLAFTLSLGYMFWKITYNTLQYTTREMQIRKYQDVRIIEEPPVPTAEQEWLDRPATEMIE